MDGGMNYNASDWTFSIDCVVFLFVPLVDPRGDGEASAAAPGCHGPGRGPQGRLEGPRGSGGRQSQPAALQLDRRHIQGRGMAQPAAGLK